MAFEDRHKAGIEAAMHHCLIHNTLLHPPSIGLAIHSAVTARPLKPIAPMAGQPGPITTTWAM